MVLLICFFVLNLINVQSAKEAYDACLKYSGSSLIRDLVDEQFIQAIIDNSAKVIDSQSEVGGWDFYETNNRPADWDSDSDGMPNDWEKKNDLDPDNPDDGKGDKNKNGYTNLEEYINSLVNMPV